MATIKYLDDNDLARVKTNIDTKLATKQDVLTAGTNITIENNVISASGGGNNDIKVLYFNIQRNNTSYPKAFIKLNLDTDSKAILKQDIEDWANGKTYSQMLSAVGMPTYMMVYKGTAYGIETNSTWKGFMQISSVSGSGNYYYFSMTPTIFSNSLDIYKNCIGWATIDITYNSSTGVASVADAKGGYITYTSMPYSYIYNDFNYNQFAKNTYLAVNNTQSFTPTGNYHPATKKYVDDSIASIPTSEIPQQDTAPSNPSEDDLWIDTSQDNLMTTDSQVSTTSTNPVQNQAITNYVKEATTGIELYNNATGGDTPITLNDNVSNYSKIEVYYGWGNSSDYGITCSKVDLSISTYVHISYNLIGGNWYNLIYEKWQLSGTSLTRISRNMRTQSAFSTDTQTKIFKVIGYKEVQ